jgi:hypothetical protein
MCTQPIVKNFVHLPIKHHMSPLVLISPEMNALYIGVNHPEQSSGN